MITVYALIVIKSYFIQLGYLLLMVVVLFILFEIVPLFFGSENRIRRNMGDLMKYQVGRSVYSVTFSTCILIGLYLSGIKRGLIDITYFSLFSQVVILYFCAECIIYFAHMAAHKYRVPILSKAHAFHHTITTDMDWVNSRKEHLFVIGLFSVVYSSLFFVVFIASPVSYVITTTLYIFFNALSHYRTPLSLKYIDQVLLFPRDHLRHHTKIGGPYGVSLSIFDTIFNTRDEISERSSP